MTDTIKTHNLIDREDVRKMLLDRYHRLQERIGRDTALEELAADRDRADALTIHGRAIEESVHRADEVRTIWNRFGLDDDADITRLQWEHFWIGYDRVKQERTKLDERVQFHKDVADASPKRGKLQDVDYDPEAGW